MRSWRNADWYDERGDPHWVPNSPSVLPPVRVMLAGGHGWHMADLDAWAEGVRAARRAERARVGGGGGGEGAREGTPLTLGGSVSRNSPTERPFGRAVE